MFDHPVVPRVMLLPQYSQVIIISPNLGAIGAAQLGHLRDVAVEGAMTWVTLEDAFEDWLGPWPAWFIFVPQREQNAASSGS